MAVQREGVLNKALAGVLVSALLLWNHASIAQVPELRVGVLLALSGPAAYLG